MSEPWNDLYVRTDLSETSPDSNRQGGLGSPDIIPAGTKPVASSDYVTDASYNTAYSNSLYQNTINYIYVRAKNSSTTLTKSGKANLVLTNPAVVLWPGGDGWTRLMAGGSYASPLLQAGSSDIEPGAIGVTDTPFEYVPDYSGHRCLVTWLDTADHPNPNPPPKITEISELVKFLKAHPNYAHHNIDIVPTSTGKGVLPKPYTQGNVGEEMRFEMTVKDCAGFVVSFSCATPIGEGKYIVMNDTTVPAQPNPFGAFGDFFIPANWQGTINLSWDAKGLTPPAGKDFIGLKVYLITRPGHEVYHLCHPHGHFGWARDSASDDTRFYPVGSVAVMTAPISS